MKTGTLSVSECVTRPSCTPLSQYVKETDARDEPFKDEGEEHTGKSLSLKAENDNMAF